MQRPNIASMTRVSNVRFRDLERLERVDSGRPQRSRNRSFVRFTYAFSGYSRSRRPQTAGVVMTGFNLASMNQGLVGSNPPQDVKRASNGRVSQNPPVIMARTHVHARQVRFS